MLYHLSIAVEDTDRVGAALAEILGGSVVAAPAPPFVAGTRFICLWDERGTMIEVHPWNTVFQPGEHGEAAMAAVPGATAQYSSVHGLFLAQASEDQIFAIAAREGWRAARVNNGPFEVINVWVENRQLLEFSTPELYPAYQATFGPANRAQLDGQLRGLEAFLRTLPQFQAAPA